MNSMKNRILTAAALAITALAGQTLSAAESAVRLSVPFAFVVAGKTMPAGDYTVEMSGSIVSVAGQHSAVLVAGGPMGLSSRGEAGLIFSRRSGTAYLVGVQTGAEARHPRRQLTVTLGIVC